MESHPVLHHSLADDTQLQKSASLQQVDWLIRYAQERVHDVKLWMTHNKLKINDDKTEALIISAPRILNSIPLPDSLVVGTTTVGLSQWGNCLGVMLHMYLTMTAHVINLIRIANFELHRINSIGYYRSVQACKILVSAFVLSRLDCCNSYLAGCRQVHQKSSKGSK